MRNALVPVSHWLSSKQPLLWKEPSGFRRRVNCSRRHCKGALRVQLNRAFNRSFIPMVVKFSTGFVCNVKDTEKWQIKQGLELHRTWLCFDVWILSRIVNAQLCWKGALRQTYFITCHLSQWLGSGETFWFDDWRFFQLLFLTRHF